jgi:hypothetical protein
MIQALDSFSLAFVEEGQSFQASNHETSCIHFETWVVVPEQRISTLLRQPRQLKEISRGHIIVNL